MKQFVIAAMGLLMGMATAQGQSLWPTDSASQASLIKVQVLPARKFKAQDIITIVVKEMSKSKIDAELDVSKDNKLDVTVPAFTLLGQNPGGRGFLVSSLFTSSPTIRTKYKKEYTGEGTLDRKDLFETHVAATILEVKPNGNLVIEAHRTITMNKEVRTVTLTGVVPASKVSAQDEVLSYHIASAKISFTSTGPVSDATRRGWLTRLGDALSAF